MFCQHKSIVNFLAIIIEQYSRHKRPTGLDHLVSSAGPKTNARNPHVFVQLGSETLLRNRIWDRWG